ncbi:MAG: NTP transferase domain-containing protein [Acetatifactor sp.]|nr:NTP transferase domain-containing protein [Acetatifactor sp.]
MRETEAFLVEKSYSLKETMTVINANSRGFALVCNGRELLGIVTDGDIRRYLLGGGNLQESIYNVANKEFFFVSENERHLAKAIMEREKITVIPVVNERQELVDILFNRPDAEQSPREAINLPLVIMAGGKGTRLWPYTNILPKPLIPIDGITITEQIMNRFSQFGCHEVFIIVNYMKDFIKAYFNEKPVNQTIHFIEEKSFLGTGGGLQYLDGLIDQPFFLTNCDVLVDCDYARIWEAHQKQGNIVTMVCARKKLIIPYGTVEISEECQILSMKEKPAIEYNINTGVYLVEPELLKLIPENQCIHFPQLMERAMQASYKVGTYSIDESQWMDMGQLEELEQMKYKLEKF